MLAKGNTMRLRNILLCAAFTAATRAAPITYSLTANSYYPSQFNAVQANACASEAFPFVLDRTTTLTFDATYSQTPHICNDPICTQDLHTFAYTQFGLYFDSAPDLGTCNKGTGALFPCTATIPAGSYSLVLAINDTTSTRAITGKMVYPFSDTVTVSVDGLATPEPSTAGLWLIGMGVTGLLARYIPGRKQR
jgi:hypothetical protein